jgi:Ig-like domain-containing protein
VVVSNSAGTVTSNAATLTVNPAPVAPSITTQPASQTVTAGQTATFSVTATGTAPLGYQWQKNGAAISGATSSSYTTPAETTSDNGAQFTVVVSNSAGTVTSNAATLTVNPAPVAPSITTQPTSQTVTAGQTATFSVSATGTAPLSYQWQKNGAAISGATSSSYTTPAETTSDNGAQFTVVVSNSAGSVTGSAATLTVNATPVAPSITTQPVSQTITAGRTATFSVTAT